MLFVKIEDLTGNLELLVFPKLLIDNEHLWQEEKIIITKGRLSDKDGTAKLITQTAEEFDSERIDEILNRLNSFTPHRNGSAGTSGNFYSQKFSRVNSGDALNSGAEQNFSSQFIDIKIPQFIKKSDLIKLKEIFSRHPGELKIRFLVKNGNSAKIINTSFSVSRPDFQNIKQQIEDVVGGGRVSVRG